MPTLNLNPSATLLNGYNPPLSGLERICTSDLCRWNANLSQTTTNFQKLFPIQSFLVTESSFFKHIFELLTCDSFISCHLLDGIDNTSSLWLEDGFVEVLEFVDQITLGCVWVWIYSFVCDSRFIRILRNLVLCLRWIFICIQG